MNVDVCVIGGGPAGSTLASRLAQLGHAVCLVERTPFPRRRLGESLSPGVLPLLKVTGARAAVEAAGFQPVSMVRVDWDHGPTERVDPGTGGLLVDRGRFDHLLLNRAREMGVEVLQPAAVRARQRHDDGWALEIVQDGRTREIHASLVADASGRSGGALPSHRVAVGPRTLALYAYWTGPGIPRHPTIEAGESEWYWGVPLPDGTYNTLAFVEAERLRGRSREMERVFLDLLDRSTLLEGCSDVRRAGPVRAVDATPYREAEPVTRSTIKVGEAGLAIDPISSSGVQKAIQSALSAAVVVHTILRRPDSAETALRFYRDTLERASDRHHEWASGHYAAVAARRHAPFWLERAAPTTSTGVPSAQPPSHPAPARGDAMGQVVGRGAPVRLPGVDTPLEVSPDLEYVDLPCIDGSFVAVKEALRHPHLEEPLAFLGGHELAPLLRELRPGLTPPQVARSWSARVPPETGLAMAAWLVRHGILVPHAGRETVGGSVSEVVA
jgi:flavin-dependent dehydrogenase